MDEENGQNLTKWRPTKAQERLLEIVLDPSNRMKSVKEICDLADVSRQTYYDAYRDENFVEYALLEAKKVAARYAVQVMGAFVNEAKRGSYQHGLVILDMAGMYAPKQRTELTGKDGGPISLQGILPKDEVEAQLRAMGLLPPAPEAEKDKEKPN